MRLDKERIKLIIKKANQKLLVGIVFLITGIMLFIFAIHASHKINEAKTFSENISDFFEHNPTWNPIITFFGGKAEEKIEENNNRVVGVQVASVILMIAGTYMIITSRRRKKNNNGHG